MKFGHYPFILGLKQSNVADGYLHGELLVTLYNNLPVIWGNIDHRGLTEVSSSRCITQSCQLGPHDARHCIHIVRDSPCPKSLQPKHVTEKTSTNWGSKAALYHTCQRQETESTFRDAQSSALCTRTCYLPEVLWYPLNTKCILHSLLQ